MYKNVFNQKPLPRPLTLGERGQVLINDYPFTKWSTTLLREEPAVLAVSLTSNLTVPPNVDFKLETANTTLDAPTTLYAASVFNVLGQNISGKTVHILVTFSLSFAGLNLGSRAVWLQTSSSTIRFGYNEISGDKVGNTLAGSCVIVLQTMESASFYMKQTSNSDLDILGGNTPNCTRWQSTLLN